MTLVFKICPEPEWRAADAAGVYRGSVHDERDGFIHFSTSMQLPGTLAKHYAGQGNLLLIAVAAVALGGALKWEPARGGSLFPHLYAPLPAAAALWVRPIALAPDGTHIIPEEAMP
jgi:uncharacterized protein (DUF952 family)